MAAMVLPALKIEYDSAVAAVIAAVETIFFSMRQARQDQIGVQSIA